MATDDASIRAGWLRLLGANAPFRLLWSARAVSYLGDSLGLVALMLHVADTTGRALAVALLLLVGDFAPALLGPLAGTLADRLDRKRVMVSCELVQGVLVAATALWLPPLPWLLVLVWLRALAGQVFQPGSRAAVPALVPNSDLERANAAIGIATNGGETLGPLSAALLLPVLDVRGVLLLDAATFLVSAALLGLLPRMPRPGSGRQARFLADTGAGLRYLWGEPTVRPVALGYFGVVACNGVDDVALVFLATDTLGAGGSAVGLLLAAVGIGLLAGYALLARTRARVPMVVLLLVGFAISSAGNLLTGLAGAVAAAFLVQAVRGLGIAGMDVAANTVLQRIVPPALLGRVFGSLYGAIGVAAALAYLLGGLLLDRTTPRITFVIAGAGGLLATLATAVALRHAIREPYPGPLPPGSTKELVDEGVRAPDHASVPDRHRRWSSEKMGSVHEGGGGMPTLLAVNVGLPRDVPWRDATVHTGIWKRPVEGPRMVRRLNIDGDGQGDLAGHGGEHRAVLVYQIDSYRYWQEQLGRDDFVYGQFGENFTVDGLADGEVCIGDRYRIGEAEFEVTQPRVTCYRVGLRMEEPRMAALLVARGRPGFYMRVLTEGRVEAGDEIVKVAEGPQHMSVAEISALLYLPGHSRDQLVRALRIPALSPGWQTSLRALLDQADSDGGRWTGNTGLTAAAGSPPPAWAGFRPLRVAGVDPESRDVFSVRLVADAAAALPAALPGQFLTLRLHPRADGPPLIRSYSLSSRPGDAQYRISVKQEPHGAASGWLRSHLRAGDTLEVAAPRGTFTLAAGEGPVLLLSAGIGATPVLAMLHALAAERSAREVWWLHGARNRAEHPFARESRALLARLPNAHAHICYSRPGTDDRQGIDYQTAGRLSTRVLEGLGLPRTADAHLCGPPAFMRELTEALVGLGMHRSRIHTETFSAEPASTPGVVAAPTRPPHPPAGGPGAGAPVSFARSGLTVNWDDAYASLLELAEACDVPVRWACRTGVCHSCETGLLSGAVAYSPEPIDQPAEGNALICCSQPQGELVLDL